jgi:hypothetical protein
MADATRFHDPASKTDAMSNSLPPVAAEFASTHPATTFRDAN